MIPRFFVAVPVPTRYKQKQNMAQNLLLFVTADELKQDLPQKML